MNSIEVKSSNISFMTYRFFPEETHRNENKLFLNIHNKHIFDFSLSKQWVESEKKSKIGEKVHKIYMNKD